MKCQESLDIKIATAMILLYFENSAIPSLYFLFLLFERVPAISPLVTMEEPVNPDSQQEDIGVCVLLVLGVFAVKQVRK